MSDENKSLPVDLPLTDLQPPSAGPSTLASMETIEYTPSRGLAAEHTVSHTVTIVVATFDRPDDLRICLRALMLQQTTRPVEVIVVDNHPASGLTAPVVREFPGVVLV